MMSVAEVLPGLVATRTHEARRRVRRFAMGQQSGGGISGTTRSIRTGTVAPSCPRYNARYPAVTSVR